MGANVSSFGEQGLAASAPLAGLTGRAGKKLEQSSRPRDK
jgi:hypothetical protein